MLPIKAASITALVLLSYVWFLGTQGANESFSTYILIGMMSCIVYYIAYITKIGR